MAKPDAPMDVAVSPREFTTTHWSVVFAAKREHPGQMGGAFEELCRIYWRPLYAYIRREGHNEVDAQDLTQGFFFALLEKNHLRHLHDQRGKFRSFLLTLLKHFLSDERAKASTQKRGGGKSFVSLDDTSADELRLESAGGLSPAQIFERRWAETVLEEALKKLRDEYRASGKGALFECLKDAQPGERGEQTYTELGARFGKSESAMKSAVHRLRLRHREILRDEIARTVASPEEVDEEIRHLLATLSG